MHKEWVKIMKILYYDCFSGISGDMNLAAMVDLGVPKEYLIEELKKLNINDEYELNITREVKNGISGNKANVILTSHHHHDENHSHGEHNQHNLHYHEENNHHHHRNLKDIEDIIKASDLKEKVKNLSLNIFKIVAEAEAKVHNKELYEVHFHEVGATDSIIDIVGAAICCDYLDIEEIFCSTVEVGSGFVHCAHGVLPVPAPATVEILNDVPIRKGSVPFEATTPTGAAILKSLVKQFTDKGEFKVLKVGYGIGHKDFDKIPNVLRVFIAEKEEKKKQCFVTECNIDDMSSEIYPYVIDRLLSSGAQDVYLTPIVMKKGRPAIKLSVLHIEEKERDIMDVLFNETTTIGVRKYKVEKSILDRDIKSISTSYGQIKIKACYKEGNMIKYKPEFEDIKRIALEKNVPFIRLYEDIKMEIKDLKIWGE